MKKKPSWRDNAWKRLSEMAGVDENGTVLPPPEGTNIDRSPTPWWTNSARSKEKA